LAAPTLEEVAAELNALAGSRLRVIPVANHWYGVVTVSGLLTGHDVVEQLRPELGAYAHAPAPDQMLLLPRVMFDNAGQVTVDDMTPAQIEAALGVPVGVAQHPAELLAVLAGELEPYAVLAPKAAWRGEQKHPILSPVEVW